ncbi:Flp family type IVb pilin [Yunchengibacter salinarum]|uniref:Flp family type IVb pilin n=1 Tax=Yunchengibacter salinarum TaxID=3133399 RepID=UPI0035B5A44D
MLTKLTKLITSAHRDERGATAIEYGLIAALVAIALITALETLGGSLSQMFTDTGTTLTEQIGDGGEEGGEEGA